jgi:hypothetical protein
MDEVDQFIKAFGSRGRHDHSVWKLDVLMDLGRFDDPRVVALYVAVIADAEEPSDVRSDALRRLREASLGPDERIVAADASLQALNARSDLQLRLHAAVVLGDFVDVPAMLGALGVLAADVAEPIELRYNAFTSLQRAGPTPACLAILRSLSDDETLGQSARALLSSWGVS